MDPSTQSRLRLAGLLLILIAVYSQALGFDFMMSWDDAGFVVNRPEIQDYWGASWSERILTPSIGYPIPLPTFIYAHLLKLSPEHYPALVHGFCLLVHLLNVLLAFVLIRRLGSASIALAAAGIWGIHPACVESVVWATNLKTLLHMTGILVSMLYWQKYLEGSLRFRKGALGVVFGFALGLASKPGAIILPALLAVQWWMFPRESKTRREMGFLGALSLVSVGFFIYSLLSHNQISKASELTEGGIVPVVLGMARSLEIATRSTLFPLDLMPEYGVLASPSLSSGLLGFAIAIAVIAAMIALWRRQDRIALGLIIIAAIFYGPYSQITYLPRFFVDTYLYGPMLGVAGTFVYLMRKQNTTKPVVASLLALFIVSGLLTLRQIPRWENAETLWGPMIEVIPTSARPYRQVSYARFNRKDYAGAAEVLTQGRDAMIVHQTIPFWAPIVFDQVGSPQAAVEWSIAMILTNKKLRGNHCGVFLTILSQHGLGIPQSASLLQASKIAVRERSAGKIPPGLDVPTPRLLRWLLTSNSPENPTGELVNEVLAHEAKKPAPDCTSWAIPGVESPPPPVCN